MDWLGFGASVLGGLFESSSAQDAYDNQMKMLEKQIEANKETMQNRHRWEVADLRQAGLNPLMSVTSPTGTLSAPSPASVQKANIAQSALAMSQISANSKMAEASLVNADANKIGAEAKMIEANNDTNRTNFMMGPEFELKTHFTRAQMDEIGAQVANIQSQTALNKLQFQWVPKLMQADLDYKQMQTAMTYLVSQAQAYNLRTTADASMVSANAHMYQAASYDRFVSSAEKLNLSQGYLNTMKGQEAVATARKIMQQTHALFRENQLNDELYKDPEFRQMYQAGAGINALLGGHSIKSMLPF